MIITGKEWSWLLLAYILGCFTAGYYWVRWRLGKDIRHMGSGSVGARNVGRVLGPVGFTLTLVLDFAKGVLAVGGAEMLGLSQEAVAGALLAVILGHNWPFQLRFQGGKGVAVSLGALLVYEPFTWVILLTLFLPLWLFTRSFTLSGMLAYSLSPLMVFLSGLGALETFVMSVAAMLLVLAHRRNIREELARIVSDRPAKSAPSHPPERGTP